MNVGGGAIGAVSQTAHRQFNLDPTNMKSHHRRSAISKSTLRRVEICIRRGWQPGFPASGFYKGTRKGMHDDAK